jgi:hypothetical protein
MRRNSLFALASEHEDKTRARSRYPATSVEPLESSSSKVDSLIQVRVKQGTNKDKEWPCRSSSS